MRQQWLSFVTAFALLTLVTKLTCALQLELYSDENYAGYLDGLETEPSQDTGCFNLAKSYTIKSVKTDKCVMMFAQKDCRSYVYGDLPGTYSFRVDSNTPGFVNYTGIFENHRWVHSLHVCSQEVGGGPALDANYYGGANYVPPILRKWRNVCTCQNVPKDIRGGKSHPISIKNFGNDMELFEGENCQGRTHVIPAGDNEISFYIFPYDLFFGDALQYDVASFRLHSPTDCFKLSALIVEFRFTNGTAEDPIVENVKLATSGQIINNGAAEITEQYTLTETVTETVTFTVAKGYTKLDSVGVNPSVSIKTKAGVPLIGQSEITASLSLNYRHDSSSSGTNTNTTTATKTTTVQVVQTIKVPGCHNCIASAYVKQAKNFPIAYESYAYVSGYASTTRMNAADIRANLPAGVSYTKDIDEFTVETLTVGTMYAEFGLQTMMDVDCTKIPDCDPQVMSKGPKTIHYEIPSGKTENWKSSKQNRREIGTFMGTYGNWNILSESSFAY